MKQYTKQFNALRVTVFGDLEPIYITDFSTSEGLGEAIGFGCRRIDAVSTRELQHHSAVMDVSVVGYVDAQGHEKNYIPNRCLQKISGYGLLMGPGILCGWENNDYAPLDTREVEIVADYFAALLDLPQNKLEAMEACFRVAGQAEYELGVKLSNERRFAEAHALFEKSWALGYADGLNALACDYLYGEGVEKMDYEKGSRLMHEAAEHGSVKAIRNIGTYSLSASHGYPLDEKKARQYLQRAADLGDGQAQGWLGFMYVQEHYGFKNTLKALKWTQEAIKKGIDVGWLTLATVICEDQYYPYQPRHVRYCLEKYMERSGCDLEETLSQLQQVEKNEAILAAKPLRPHYPEISWEMFEASQADPFEQYQQAVLLLRSAENARKGMELMLQAAEQGCCYAMYSVGSRSMDNGQGDDFSYFGDGGVNSFPKDFHRAWNYLCRTAFLGEADVLYLLPFSYQNFGEDLARRMLSYYVELTGDGFVERYVLPNLKKALEISAAGHGEPPRITMQELEILEQTIPQYTRQELPVFERIRLLEEFVRGDHCDAPEAVGKLLAVYRWMELVLPADLGTNDPVG